MTPHLLAVGYLTTRVVADDPVLPKDAETIVLPHLLAISHFVCNTLTIHATRAKYLLRTSPEGTAANNDLIAMLSESLSGKCDQQERFGVIPLKDGLCGLLKAPASRTDCFILQVIAPLPGAEPSIYTPSHLSEEWQQLSLKRMPAMPFEVMQLCQQASDPACYHTLQSIAQQVHHVANTYGYWDLWAVLVGICDRFQIDAQRLLATTTTSS